MKLGIASDYVDFCLALNYQDLPVEVVERVKQLKLDYIGTPAYGTQADSSRAMLEFIRSLNLKGYCTLIGTSTKCPARAVIKTKDRRKREASFERPCGEGCPARSGNRETDWRRGRSETRDDRIEYFDQI